MPNNAFGLKHTLAPTISLFTSAGTLICCALPALLVSLGMGAVMAGLASNFPALIWLSTYKVWVFAVAAVMIILSGTLMVSARNLPCPADPAKAKACTRLRTISWWIWALSVLSYLTGFFFAFIAPKIFF